MSARPKLGSYHPTEGAPGSGSAEVWVPDTHPELVAGSRLRVTIPGNGPIEVEVVSANRIPGAGWWNINFTEVAK